MMLPFAIGSWCDNTIANARWYRTSLTAMLVMGSVAGHALVWRHWKTRPFCAPSILSHIAVSWVWDWTFTTLVLVQNSLIEILSLNRGGNRLKAGKIHGPRVLVVGNGPSAIEGEPLGENIDKFDEVVRFNNFQTKVVGLEKFVGTKTTVHFSDGVLYPTYKEYHVPGADIVLSLFTDRFMVAGSYFILRGGADLQTSLTASFLKDPAIGWITKASIERL